ncbi:MAG: hypothetical protein AAFZ65_00665 [Planctomycetota bacterium]
MTARRLAYLLLAALPLTGCLSAGPGPAAVVVERGAFNEAIQRTNAEQLLLNIVRLRYVDPPLFLELSSIASQLEVELEGSLDANLLEARNDQLGIGGSITTTRAPTVSYTPLQGEQFVRQLLTPIDVRTLVLLYHSGWSIERLLRLTVQRLGPLRNAPRASGPRPTEAPDYALFLRTVHHLRDLQRAGRLELGESAESGLEGRQQLVFQADLPLDDDAEDPALLVREELGLPLDVERIALDTSLVPSDTGYTLVPRSLIAMLAYASQAVEVPPEDFAAGKVNVTRAADGSPFDWNPVFEGLFEVHWASTRPQDAYIAVRYRGRWFYIADDDIESKATIVLLDQLFALQGGTRSSSTPLLTIPIGGS